MIAANHLPAISSDEWLARFITDKKWLRQDRTVRPDAFMPPRDLKLSVTRHLDLKQSEIWQIGDRVVQGVATTRTAVLAGRADITVAEGARRNLATEAAPVTGNSHHAHVVGWPEKSARKSIAQELAGAAIFVARQHSSRTQKPS